MKQDLINLIDSVDDIEKLFHESGGKGFPVFKVIMTFSSFRIG